MPRSPKRSRTRSGGIAANSPSVCTPSRASSPTRSACPAPGASAAPPPSDDASSTATDSGARNPAAPPAGTTKTGSPAMVAAFAACSAVNGPSATPARTPSSPASCSTSDQHPRRLCLAAVVARRTPRAQRAEPRPHHLHPGSVLFDARHDRGERAVIARLRRRERPSARDIAPARHAGAALAAHPRPERMPSTPRPDCAPSPRRRRAVPHRAASRRRG